MHNNLRREANFNVNSRQYINIHTCTYIHIYTHTIVLYLPAERLVLRDQPVRPEQPPVRVEFEVQAAALDLLQPAGQRLHVRVDNQVARRASEQLAALCLLREKECNGK